MTLFFAIEQVDVRVSSRGQLLVNAIEPLTLENSPQTHWFLVYFVSSHLILCCKILYMNLVLPGGLKSTDNYKRGVDESTASCNRSLFKAFRTPRTQQGAARQVGGVGGCGCGHRRTPLALQSFTYAHESPVRGHRGSLQSYPLYHELVVSCSCSAR